MAANVNFHSERLSDRLLYSSLLSVLEPFTWRLFRWIVEAGAVGQNSELSWMNWRCWPELCSVAAALQGFSSAWVISWSCWFELCPIAAALRGFRSDWVISWSSWPEISD